MALLKKYWFIAVLLSIAFWGATWPLAGDWLHKQTGTSPFIFVLLFFTGLTFNTSELKDGLRAPKAMAFSLAGTYLLLPALFWVAALPFGFDSQIGKGLLVLGAVPTTLASAVIWTRLAGGSAALAVMMTVLSNLLNVLLAPAVLWVIFGAENLNLPVMKIIQKLALFVVLPIMMGQVVRRFSANGVTKLKSALAVASQLLICCVILMAVSSAATLAAEAGAAGTALVSPLEIAGLVAACVVVHALAVAALEGGSRLLRLPLPQRIATVFIGGQKTLPVGAFILASVFPRHGMGVLSVVVYHAVQLIFDSFLIDWYKGQAEKAAGNEAAADPSGEEPAAAS